MREKEDEKTIAAGLFAIAKSLDAVASELAKMTNEGGAEMAFVGRSIKEGLEYVGDSITEGLESPEEFRKRAEVSERIHDSQPELSPEEK